MNNVYSGKIFLDPILAKFYMGLKALKKPLVESIVNFYVKHPEIQSNIRLEIETLIPLHPTKRLAHWNKFKSQVEG